MAKPVTKLDLLWGYTATALNNGAGLILLPVILRYLTLSKKNGAFKPQVQRG